MKTILIIENDTQTRTIVREFTAHTPSSTNHSVVFPSIPKLSECFNFIEENYHQQISLRDVAQAVGYSPAYLTDLVRRQTGQSVCRWIIKRRMAEARRLLLVTSQSVQAIAEAVGYFDTSYFIRQFRQLNGIPPQAWRKAHQSHGKPYQLTCD